jgi:hypothetical protein
MNMNMMAGEVTQREWWVMMRAWKGSRACYYTL